MSRSKNTKQLSNHTNERIFEQTKDAFFHIKGKWHAFFGNMHPLVLELGCGYGEYTIGLAQVYPHTNFVGIDIKGDRLWQGATNSETLGLHNTAFVRAKIHDLRNSFADAEVDDIWLIHPDPRPRTRDIRRRLVFDRFLDIYAHILKKTGTLRLKTDDRDLFVYALENCQKNKWILTACTYDLATSDLAREHHGITTRYEKHFVAQGRTICYAVRSHPAT